MPSVSVAADLSNIARYAKTLDKQSATAFRRRIRAAVADTGGDALRRAKANASWSTGKPDGEGHPRAPIASAISLRTSFATRSASVKMRTDRNKAPQAYFYERGSKGSGGGYIRHPTFGRKSRPSDWKNTPTRPFFYRAVWDHKDDLKNRLGEEIVSVARELGYSG